MKLNSITDRTHVDSISIKNGVITVRRGYFYSGGKTAQDFADRIQRDIPEAKIIDYGEHWAAFKGGASVAKQSHWWVKFTV
jgi:hypothetical protein